MKEIRLSVKEHRLTNEYNPTFKKYDYTQSFDFENEDDIELIYKNVNLFVHTYYEYHENTRNEESFKSATAIFLDFDGKDGHNDSTINEFLDSNLAKTYKWFFYTSKSHTPSQECYHVILPLDTPITDIHTLRATYSSIFEEVQASGLKCDFKVRDGARLIFPSLNESTYDENEYFDNFRFETHYDGAYLKSTTPKVGIDVLTQPAIIKHNIVDVQKNDEDFNIHVNEFNKMSSRSKYNYIRSVVKFMNTKNRKSGYTFLNYNRWISVGFTLYRLFGAVNGKKLFRLLSGGHPKDTTKSIDDKFDLLSSDSNSSNENVSILMKMSASVGFGHTMYFKYYFMGKHRFSPSKSLFLYQRMVRKLLDDNCMDDVHIKHVKLYDYSFKKNTRSFLMEISDNGISHVTVRLGEMMDIMAKMLDIPRQFVTIAITKGIIRRFINNNGVYDITRYIKTKLITLLEEAEGDYIRVNDVNEILKTIRSYAPSTIQNLLTNKNIELYMFEIGVFSDKCKKRFNDNGTSKPYMAYKLSGKNIILTSSVSFTKDINYTKPNEPLPTIEHVEPVQLQPKRKFIMKC